MRHLKLVLRRLAWALTPPSMKRSRYAQFERRCDQVRRAARERL